MHPRLLSLAATVVLATSSSLGAISVGLGGTGVQTFDSLPPPDEWSTAGIPGGAGNVSTADGLDTLVQTYSAASVSSSLLSSSLSPPGTSATGAQWSSSGQYIQTRPAGLTAILLLAQLRNDTGGHASLLNLSYDVTARSVALEEINVRTYFSTSGQPGSWVFLTEYGSSTTVALEWIDVGNVPPGGALYLLWADDNSVVGTDTGFGIDNFRASLAEPTCVDVIGNPVSVTVPERGLATFSMMATGAPQTFRWFRSDDQGASYSQVPMANATTLSITAAAYPEDNGARFFATVSNSWCQSTSAVAVLTVQPDLTAPFVVHAVEDADLDKFTLSFSEALSPQTVNEANFILFENGTDPAWGEYVSFFATLSNGTNVTVLTDPRDPVRDYSVAIYEVYDTSSQTNAIVPNPTIVTLRKTQRLIDFDSANLWKWTVQTNLFGSGWETMGYDDSDPVLWFEGPAGLGNDSDNAVPLRTQTGYNFDSAPQFFRRAFTLPGSTNGLQLRMRHVFEDGAVVFLNGQEAGRFNVGPGPLGVTTRAISGAPANAPIAGPVSLPVTNLFPGENVIAVAVFQVGTSSGDMFMALELTAEFPPPLCHCPEPRILDHPRSQAANEGQGITLSVFAEGAVPLHYRWYKDNLLLPWATSPIFTIGGAIPSDAGNYFVIVSNYSGSVTSRVATITIGDPPEPPLFLSAVADLNGTNITVTFGNFDFLNFESAQNTNHYSVTPGPGAAGLTVYSTARTSPSNVVLTTNPRTPNVNYVVTLTGVVDRSTAQRPVTPASRLLDIPQILLGPDGFQVWRYDQSGIDRTGTGWADSDYDDSQWSSGVAGFASGEPGFETGPDEFLFRTHGLVPPFENGPNTMYFRTRFYTPGSVLKWRGIVDDGAVFYINGSEAGRIRMGSNEPIFFATLASSASPENTNFHLAEGPIFLSTTNVKAFCENVLAIELHQNAFTSSDVALSIQLYVEMPYVIPSPPSLRINRDAATGEVTLSWTGCGTLLETSELRGDAPIWNNVPGNPNPYRSYPTNGTRFFAVAP